MTQDKQPSGSEPIKVEYQLGTLDDVELGPIPPQDSSALDDIWQYDGTGGHDTRPEFVQADDERIRQGRA